MDSLELGHGARGWSVLKITHYTINNHFAVYHTSNAITWYHYNHVTLPVVGDPVSGRPWVWSCLHHWSLMKKHITYICHGDSATQQASCASTTTTTTKPLTVHLYTHIIIPSYPNPLYTIVVLMQLLMSL